VSQFAQPALSEDRVISPDVLKHYKEQFNLSGQLDLLLQLDQSCCLAGKAVLEIGGSNIPKPFALDVLKAKRWVSVDHVYPQNRILWPRQYADTETVPVGPNVEFDELADFAILDGNVEYLPHSFDGRFDAIVSIDAFEHVLRFATMLDRAYNVLRPGGILTALYSPIWSSHIGHHLWGVTDKIGRTFYIESSPIPPWGHLLMRPPELYCYLLDRTDAETAGEIVYQVHHTENLNRLFVEDFEAYFRNSRFRNCCLLPYVQDVVPAPDVQLQLERLHPGRKQFSWIGILVSCEKP
jgi:SAM-dependent methyltransferase